jgi:hypothetical protein
MKNPLIEESLRAVAPLEIQNAVVLGNQAANWHIWSDPCPT